MLSIFLPSLLIGQTFESGDINEDWKLIIEQDGVEIYASKTLCDFNGGFNEYSIILRVENKNNVDILVSYTNDLYYAGGCINCGSAEAEFSFDIKASEQIEGICSREINNGLRIWDSFEGYEAKKTLSQFSISNLKIEKK